MRDGFSEKGLRLPAIICGGMVLQREASPVVWGLDEPGCNVRVRFRGQTCGALAGADGRWAVTLPKQTAGGPFNMEIEGSETVELHDIVVGDVWLCAGQSNMQMPMERVKDRYPDTVAQACDPFIRQFEVPERYEFGAPAQGFMPAREASRAAWRPLCRDTVLSFSAVGLFFANRIRADFSVPVGIVKMAVGGARLEAWMSRAALTGYPAALRVADRFADTAFTRELLRRETERERRWQARLDADDRGLRSAVKWYAEGCDDSAWPSMELPCYLSEGGLPEKNGAFWFRKTVEIPGELAGKPARLLLGRVVDADFAYVNGVLVGKTDYQYPPRKYEIPAGLLRTGNNTVAVRVVSLRGRGGFITDKAYKLLCGGYEISLEGKWKYRAGTFADPLTEKIFLHEIPTGLYNGMLAPTANYTVKGALWYQGESNASAPEGYGALFARLIADWREALHAPNLPFLFVQLPNYLERENPEAVGKWAYLREAQLNALHIPATGMAVTIDAGEWNDLHPLDKRTVGERLALAACRTAYGGTETAASGPLYHHMEVRGETAVLHFTEVGSGLIASDGKPLRGFEMSGPGGVYFPAQARIEGDTVAVSCCEVDVPVNVRYAWCDNPKNINFYNREKLPASPFRTETIIREKIMG